MPQTLHPTEVTFEHNAFGDEFIAPVNAETFRERAYAETWQQRYAPLTYSPNHTYVVAGTDSGMLIKAFARALAEQPPALVFIEDERVIDAVAANCAAELAELPHAELMTLSQFREACENRVYDNALLTGRISALKAVCAEADHLGSYRAIDEQIHFVLHSRRWLVMSTSVRLPYLQQRLLNLPEMAVNASLLKRRFAGQTVVVMAAGPSLDDHLPWVKTHRESLIVISVSRISRRLQQTGITPDIVVTLDPHDISFEVSREGLDFTPAPVLVFSDQAVNTLVGQWSGPKIYTGTRVPWTAEDDEHRSNASTVSNLAFDVARLGEPERIILMGLDFCLDKAGHTHAQGNMERDTGVSLRTDMEEVTTYDGSVRLSSVDYYTSGKSLEAQITALETPCTVYNPSPGAMRLDGVTFAPLETLTLAPDATRTPLDVLHNDIEQTRAHSDWLREGQASLRRFRHRISRLEKLAGDGLRIVKEAKREGDVSPRLVQRLNRIDKEIRKKYLEERRFCVSNCGNLFADILDTGAQQDTIDHGNTLEKSGNIYSAYRKSIQLIRPMLEDTQDSLGLLNAESDDVWPEALSARFLQLGLPRRILRSQARIDDTALTAAHELLQAQQQMQTQRLKSVLNDMQVSAESLFKTLNGAYVQQSVDKLTHYQNAIREMRDFALHPLYLHLADAYLAEVQGDDESALSSYQAIVDAGENPLLEEALNRAAYLCIRTGDTQTAMLALTVLSELNPMYQAALEQFKRVA